MLLSDSYGHALNLVKNVPELSVRALDSVSRDMFGVKIEEVNDPRGGDYIDLDIEND